MDAAKNAVKDFMAKSGHHDTTVHERVAPAVTHETINRQRHEEITTAVDKEIHQDHYHTSIQPVTDTQVLPEQHHHNLAAVEHRTFEHGNDREVAERLKLEAAKFRDERVEGETRHTSSVAPTIAGEHIHHHVHETIQPVVNKQTIEPHVVHTTVPIHEVHHNAAQHHTTSALPAVSMADFKKQGGVLTGREERYDGFEGEPRSVGGALGSGHTGAGLVAGAAGATAAASAGHHHGTGRHHGTGLTGRTRRGSSSSSSSSDDEKRRLRGTKNSAVPGGATRGPEYADREGARQPQYGSGGTESVDPTHNKPGLLDRLNPLKDTDRDGRKGFMD
ncbi:hypothetical protein H2203_002943 [Taxawa tesnikishii (nom. ined.)]|nr:hypothetical protein H2203_002943 [Dothideales sp. JES 119]